MRSGLTQGPINLVAREERMSIADQAKEFRQRLPRPSQRYHLQSSWQRRLRSQELVWATEYLKFNNMSKFTKLANKLDKKKGISKEGANALAAFIGRKKYGKEQFQKMAIAGKKKK